MAPLPQQRTRGPASSLTRLKRCRVMKVLNPLRARCLTDGIEKYLFQLHRPGANCRILSVT
jgi:hypothetical protein